MTQDKIDKSILQKCKTDALFFVRTAIGAEPTDQQAQLLTEVSKPGAHVSVRSGHGPGKTTVFAWLVLWFVGLYTDCRVPCTAPTGHQLNDLLWPEISKWLNNMHPLWKRDMVVTSDKVFVKDAPKTQYAVARTARPENPEALQGFHANNLMFLIDEAPGIEEPIFEVAEGALSTPDARVVMTANPTRTEGYFYRSHHEERHFWTTLHFDCLKSPLVAQEYIDKMKERYGKESNIFKVRVRGDFPEASEDVLIPLSWVQEAHGRNVEYPSAQRVAGLDVARFGDDANSLVIRQGQTIFHLDQWRNYDLMQTVGKVADLYRKEQLFDLVHVDSIGLGAGVVDRLQEMNIPVAGVNVAESSPQNERFNRLRDQLWWSTREFFEYKQSRIEPDIKGLLLDDLIGQLTSIRYGFTSNGKIRVEGKDEAKKRGLESPNLADALNLTFAEGLGAQRKAKAKTVKKKSAKGWT